MMRRIEEKKQANTTLTNQIQERKRQQKREEEQSSFDKKLTELANKAVKFEQQYGPEDPFTVIINTFFEGALALREVMEQISAMNLAMDCFGDAMSFMDGALDFDNQVMQASMQKDHGFFARIKARNEKKKAMANFQGRVMSIFNNIIMNYEMITSMSTGMLKLSGKIKKKVGKLNKKAPAPSAGTPGAPSSARSFLEKNGAGSDSGAGAPSPSAPPPAASAPAPAPSGASVGSGIDGL